MEKIKIIFLDLDGVLNVISQGFDKHGSVFHQHFMDNLKMIIDETGAKIVISSSWRKNGLIAMQNMWKDRGLAGEVIDVTPTLYLKTNGGVQFWNNKLGRNLTQSVGKYTIPRGSEIEYWLKHEAKYFGDVVSYVILDDDTDILLSQKKNFVQCSENIEHNDCIDVGYGLTLVNANRAIGILNVDIIEGDDNLIYQTLKEWSKLGQTSIKQLNDVWTVLPILPQYKFKNLTIKTSPFEILDAVSDVNITLTYDDYKTNKI